MAIANAPVKSASQVGEKEEAMSEAERISVSPDITNVLRESLQGRRLQEHEGVSVHAQGECTFARSFVVTKTVSHSLGYDSGRLYHLRKARRSTPFGVENHN